ncbi:MAG: DUF4268 domain-containing protein [Rhodobacteraceae bacterium]|nr:DUF4268 domain-containing protein [Paracoccaceae bacterium]MCY4197123.1 DUF4268 domain-containing protein [Paracoccaceae bacterium]
MNQDALGRLVRVDLRDIWASEASDFTPWLAQEENLSFLGDTLGIDLELEAQEKAVGPFRADILCKNIGTGTWVLVENQLERTDHNHLGQLLTYASGLEAVTIIWISARFTEEHRSTLDWLNRITDESIRFFGLEVELWRINDSSAAPKFNIVSKPNDWSRSVAQAARAIDETELSELRIMQRDYWAAFHRVLESQGGAVSGKRKPQPQSWMSYSIGRREMNLGTTMIRSKNRIRVELYLGTEQAKAFFHLLRAQKDDIERELGSSLEWEELPDRRDSRIAVYLDKTDPEDREDWTRQHSWLAKSINDLHRVFVGRVKSLDADDWNSNTVTIPPP